MLKTSVECSSHQEDALILMKATKIVCNEIFHHMDLNLMALFLMTVNKSVPTNLKMLVNLLLRGGDITDQDSTESQPCLTIAQLVLFKRLPLLRRKLLF